MATTSIIEINIFVQYINKPSYPILLLTRLVQGLYWLTHTYWAPDVHLLSIDHSQFMNRPESSYWVGTSRLAWILNKKWGSNPTQMDVLLYIWSPYPIGYGRFQQLYLTLKYSLTFHSIVKPPLNYCIDSNFFKRSLVRFLVVNLVLVIDWNRFTTATMWYKICCLLVIILSHCRVIIHMYSW